MTQEEKDKLLKYLCMALPYRVFMTNNEYPETHYPFTWREVHDLMYEEDFNDIPYLRPMSSMTDEEDDTYRNLLGYEPTNFPNSEESLDFALKKHLDFLELIPMGLAIEVTEDNNPYKD